MVFDGKLSVDLGNDRPRPARLAPSGPGRNIGLTRKNLPGPHLSLFDRSIAVCREKMPCVRLCEGLTCFSSTPS